MFKRSFTCPTCGNEFERQIQGVLGGDIPSIRYCSVTCNTGLEKTSTEIECACGVKFDSYDGQTQCSHCQLPSGLRNALAKIEEEYGGNVMEEMY